MYSQSYLVECIEGNVQRGSKCLCHVYELHQHTQHIKHNHCCPSCALLTHHRLIWLQFEGLFEPAVDPPNCTILFNKEFLFCELWCISNCLQANCD